MSDPDQREPIRIVIADDHRVVRSGLRLLLCEEQGLDVVGEAGDAAQAARLVAELDPDVLLLDISMPGRSGLDVIPELRESSPDTAIVVLTMQSDPAFAARAIRNGAAAFILKDAAHTELVQAIRTVACGGTCVGTAMARAASAVPEDGLTSRELEVLRLIALGHTNPEIAGLLGLSIRTVESHRAHIANKLGRTTRAELVRHAMDLQLVG